MPGAVFTLYPAEAVAVVVEPVWAHRFQDIAQALFQLRLEPVQAAMVDRVFQAGMLAFGTVAEIALYRDDAFGQGNNLFRCHEYDKASKPGVGCAVAMRGTHDRTSTHLKSSH